MITTYLMGTLREHCSALIYFALDQTAFLRQVDIEPSTTCVIAATWRAAWWISVADSRMLPSVVWLIQPGERAARRRIDDHVLDYCGLISATYVH